MIDRVNEYMNDSQVQPNWGFESSVRATDRIKRGKQAMAEFINADPGEIVLGPSTTLNVYLMTQALRSWWKAGDEIIVTGELADVTLAKDASDAERAAARSSFR